tara:strand:- start:109 stop:462 length:354 start_codon:yes stop_codon:yes gene_type:complete
MKLIIFSFLMLITLLANSCNSKKNKDLNGFYLDENQIELLSVTQIDSSNYELSNQSGKLKMVRSQDTLIGLTQLKDTIKMKFHSPDSISYHFWGTLSSYKQIDTVSAQRFIQKRKGN